MVSRRNKRQVFPTGIVPMSDQLNNIYYMVRVMYLGWLVYFVISR